VYQAAFTEVDQPEDVIWRNFGVSLFEVCPSPTHLHQVSRNASITYLSIVKHQ
jgi:hypothetical protein